MAFVWAAAGAYSFEYMAHEENQKRYYSFYLCTLGVLMAQLDAHPDYTVAQFAQAIGAIYFGCLGLL